MSDWADGDLYDRIDELRAENATLRATIEARDDALMRAGRDNLRLGRIVEACRPVAEWAKTATVDIDYAQGLARTFEQLVTDATGDIRDGHAVVASEAQRALALLDGAPDPRRVESAEELDALPFTAVIRETLPLRATGNDLSRVWEKWRDGWTCIGGKASSTDMPELPAVVLPAVVLWLPEVSS